MESNPSMYRKVLQIIKGDRHALAAADAAMEDAIEMLEQHRAKFKTTMEIARHETVFAHRSPAE